jgi:hypothetical protein
MELAHELVIEESAFRLQLFREVLAVNTVS